MASGTFYPAEQADDGSRYGLTSLMIYNYLVLGNYNAETYHIFVRFLNVTIPTGATITSAFIRFTAQATGSAIVCNEELSFNDIDDAVAPENYTEYDALVKTSAKVDWTAIGAWSTDVQYDSVDMTIALQEVVDRAGWDSGNAIMLLGDGTDSDSSAHRYADVYSGTGKAELHVTWTGGATESIKDLSTEIVVSAQNILDLSTEIAVDFAIGFTNLLSDIQTSVQITKDLSTEISVSASSILDLSTEIAAGTAAATKFNYLKTEIAAAFITDFTDLLSNIQAFARLFQDLKTNIETDVPVKFADLKAEIGTIYPLWVEFLRLRHGHIPARNELNVPVDRSMIFNVYNPDPAFGVDVATFKVRLNEGVWYRYGNARLTFAQINDNEYLICFRPPKLAYDTQVMVELYCEDNAHNPGIKLEIL